MWKILEDQKKLSDSFGDFVLHDNGHARPTQASINNIRVLTRQLRLR